MNDRSVSIEVPVFKGAFLRPCVESVLAQTSRDWTLSLSWDGGDRQSLEVLEALQREGHPRIQVYFTENQGIAATRRFLTDRSSGAWVLPLDDDDMLAPHAVARFLQFAAEHPWASLVRARRGLIGPSGATSREGPLFPFSLRNYWRGMVTDPFNQAQPYIIRRSAYRRTQGWRGFADFKGAGEDCDIFLQLEEVAHFELIDEILYYYRVHDTRASVDLKPEAGYEMWRRLIDATLARLGLPLKRSSTMPPFIYEGLPVPQAGVEDVGFVIGGSEGATTESLRRCGIADSAIHAVTDCESSIGWQMTGFRMSAKPLVCFMHEDVAIADRTALEKLIGVMNVARADVVAIRAHPGTGGLLLLRREVILATGGFDSEWAPPSLRELDLWLQARRREFRCIGTAVAGINAPAPADSQPTAEDVVMLQAKWASYPALLAELASGGDESTGRAPA